MAREWFSSPDYSPEAMRDFEVRLARARLRHRSQYLGLKALYLAELEIAEADQIAIALLHRVINGQSGIFFEFVCAHEKLGSIYERMGRFEDAEREYRWVVKSYREGRSGSSGVCDLTLAELISELSKVSNIGKQPTCLFKLRTVGISCLSLIGYVIGSLRPDCLTDSEGTRKAPISHGEPLP